MAGEVLNIFEGHVLIEEIGHHRDPEACREHSAADPHPRAAYRLAKRRVGESVFKQRKGVSKEVA